MRRLLPYPLLWLGLAVMWLLLAGSLTAGSILLALLVATLGCWVVLTLAPERPKLRRLGTMVALLGAFVRDIVQSNIAVAGLILSGRKPRSAFLQIPLELSDLTGLAILSLIVTATPGSAWIQYESRRGVVTIHVLDVADGDAWIAGFKRNYEQRLIEILQ